DIFTLVLLRDGDVFSSRLEFILLHSTKRIVLHREGMVQHVLYHPAEAAVQVWVHTLQVVQCDGLAQQLLVERHREPPVQVVAVEDGHADHAPHKVEVRQLTYRVNSRVRVDLQSVDIISRVLKQAVVRVEHLVGQQVEPFSAEKT
ncbi:hypothetical protein EGW08_002149, partial [Elysia chlorotica]